MSFLIAAVLATTGAPSAGVEFTSDPLDVVRKNLTQNKAILVDVRTPEEWKQGRVAGAVHLPIDLLRQADLDPQRLARILPKDKIAYTYCKVGGRAKAAASVLQRLGYQVRPLRLGYQDLLKAGFKGVKTPERAATAPESAPQSQ